MSINVKQLPNLILGLAEKAMEICSTTTLVTLICNSQLKDAVPLVRCTFQIEYTQNNVFDFTVKNVSILIPRVLCPAHIHTPMFASQHSQDIATKARSRQAPTTHQQCQGVNYTNKI